MVRMICKACIVCKHIYDTEGYIHVHDVALGKAKKEDLFLYMKYGT